MNCSPNIAPATACGIVLLAGVRHSIEPMRTVAASDFGFPNARGKVRKSTCRRQRDHINQYGTKAERKPSSPKTALLQAEKLLNIVGLQPDIKKTAALIVTIAKTVGATKNVMRIKVDLASVFAKYLNDMPVKMKNIGIWNRNIKWAAVPDVI
jgi:hypothetical protein